MAEIDKLEIAIESSADQAAKAINVLTGSLKGLDNAASNITGLQKVNAEISKLKDNLSTIVPIKDIVKAMPQMEAITPKVDTSALDAVQNSLIGIGEVGAIAGATVSEALKDIEDADPSSLEATKEVIQELGDSLKDITIEIDDSDLTSTTERLSEAGDSAEDLDESLKPIAATNFKALLSDLGRIAIVLKVASSAAKAFMAPVRAMSGGLRRAASAIEGVKTALMGTNRQLRIFDNWLGKALKSIVLYRVIRRLFTNIAMAFREGTRNVTQFSNAAQAAMSSIITDTLYLRNAFGALAAPALELIAPIFMRITAAIVQATEALSRFLALLMGRSTFIRAKRDMQQYGAAAGGTARQIRSISTAIDELNVIEPPGAGGGAGAEGIGDWFEEVPIEGSFLMDMLDALMGGLDALKEFFFNLGADIGFFINRVLRSIPWDKIHDIAMRLGKAVAWIVNGMLHAIDWDLVGGSIAEFFNTFVILWATFAENIQWHVVGDAIARTINSFFRRFNFKRLAEAINAWYIGLLDAMITALKRIEWREIGETLGDFLSAIQWRAIFTRVGEAAGRAVNAIVDTLAGIVDRISFAGFGQSIARGIMCAVNTINWAGLGKLISDITIGLFSLFYEAISGVDWRAIGNAIGTFLRNIDWRGIARVLLDIVKEIFSGVFELLSGIMGEGLATGVISIITGAVAAIAALGITAKIGALITAVKALSTVLFTVAGPIGLIVAAFTGLYYLTRSNKGAILDLDTATRNLERANRDVAAAMDEYERAQHRVEIASDANRYAQNRLEEAKLAVTEAQEALNNATEEYLSYNDSYIRAVNNADRAAQQLTDVLEANREAMDKNEWSLESLIESVEAGVLSYSTMDSAQKKVWEAFVANEDATNRLNSILEEHEQKLQGASAEAIALEEAERDLEDAMQLVESTARELNAATVSLTEASENHAEAIRKETEAYWDNELAMAAQMGSHRLARQEWVQGGEAAQEYRDKVVQAYRDNTIGAEEAALALSKAMADMSDSTRETFVENIPNSIKQGLDPSKYESTIRQFGRSISDFFNSVFRIGSPSKMMIEKGEAIGDGVVVGISNREKAIHAEASKIGGSMPSGIEGGVKRSESSALNAIRSLIDNITDTAKTAIGGSNASVFENEVGRPMITGIVDGIVREQNKVTDAITRLLDTVRRNMTARLPEFQNFGREAMARVVTGMLSEQPRVVSTASNIMRAALNAMQGMVGEFHTVGVNAMNGLANGIAAGTHRVVAEITEAARRAVAAAQAELVIRSPSKVFENAVGKMMMLGWATGISDNVGYVISAISEVSKELQSATGDIDFFENIGDSIKEVTEDVVDFVDVLKDLSNMSVSAPATYSTGQIQVDFGMSESLMQSFMQNISSAMANSAQSDADRPINLKIMADLIFNSKRIYTELENMRIEKGEDIFTDGAVFGL